jgi:membrane AbrB-like protein
LLLAALAGLAAQLAHVPLAWILGPLLATAIAAIAGAPIFAPLSGRRVGQIVVGTSIGLNITAPVLLLMGIWLPVMIITALIGVFLAAIVSVPFSAISGTDRKTAFYSMMPGGLAEMATLGAAAGAQSEPIAISQALRVALLVCILPPLIIGLDIHGSVSDGINLQSLPLLQAAAALVIGLAGVMLARLLRLNNPWMIGALTGAGIAAASGLFVGRLPLPLYWFGQFLIGISIGSRFKREVVLRLPRVFVISAVFVLILAALLFGYAALLSSLTGLDLASATLGASPGGLAEMAITAQTLHLSVGLVTGFHVVRAFVVNGFATKLWVGFHRVGLFAGLDWIAGRLKKPR